MDVLRALASPDIEVRKKTLNLALDLVSSRNVEELVKFLKKEITKTSSAEGHDSTAQYRQLLVKTMHQCTTKFPECVSLVIPSMMNFLGDKDELAAADVLKFVREAVHKYQDHKTDLLDRLLMVFPSVTTTSTLGSMLWILGEYCEQPEEITNFMKAIEKSVGDLPIVEKELKLAAGDVDEDEGEKKDDQPEKNTKKKKVTEMGLRHPIGFHRRKQQKHPEQRHQATTPAAVFH